MAARSPSYEREVILEIYKQRYAQVQHLQQMRANYFNLYIVVVGFGISAILGGYGSLGQIPVGVALCVGGLIYVVSLLSIMRAERWTGHILHDLRAIRKVQNYYSSKFRSVADIIPFNPKPLSSLEFDRPLWDRNRSIETPGMMIGAILSSWFIAYYLPIPENWILAALLSILAILVWRAEVSNLIRRHSKCCISLSPSESQQSELIKG